MAITLTSLLNFLKDVAPGLIGTWGTPAAPEIGDTDWSGVAASEAAVDEAFDLTNGQLLIGKTGGSAITNPAAAPVLTAGTGGTLAAGAYEVAYTWKNTYGETQISPTATITFASGTTNKISVAAVTPLPTGALSANWYMSDAPGSITLKFVANNAGTAFSISALPISGALVPSASNGTASANHPVKGTITGSNGIAVTNGAGTIDVALNSSGDITATGGVVSVTGVQGVPFDAGSPTDGQVYAYNSTLGHAEWQDPSGGTSSLTNTHIFVGNGSGVAADVAMSGDATIANTGAVTVAKVNGITITGTPAIGDVPTATSTSAAHWAAPSGGSSSLTSAHIFVGNGSGVAADVAVSGDASLSNTGAVTVTKVNGNAVASTAPSAGDVWTWNNTTHQMEPAAPAGGSGGADATSIQGVNVSATAPADGEALVYDSGTAQYIPGTVSGGGGTFIGGGAYATSTQSLSAAVATYAAFDVEDFDTDGMVTLGSDNTKITINTTGIYMLVATAAYAATGSNPRQTTIFKNNSAHLVQQLSPNTPNGTYHSFCRVVQLTSGDYLQLQVYDVDGGGLTVSQMPSSLTAIKLD